MVVSGECEQDAEQSVGQLHYSTGPMPERRVKHETAGVFLKFGRVSPDRIEFSILKMTEEVLGKDTKRARRSNLHDYPPKA